MDIPTGIPTTIPDDVEWCMADNVFIKQMAMVHANTVVPQHSHTYDHTSLLATGSARVWKNGVFWQDIKAPMPIFIKAGIKHTFMSLEPNTVIYCIHNSNGDVSIQEYA